MQFSGAVNKQLKVKYSHIVHKVTYTMKCIELDFTNTEKMITKTYCTASPAMILNEKFFFILSIMSVRMGVK